MNQEEIESRLNELSNALYYDRMFQRVFSTGQRIVINQERGSLMSQLSYLKFETPEYEVRTFKISNILNQKVKYCNNKIN